MGKILLIVMLVFVSMAGWMNGADTGSISGITHMRDFQSKFADRYDQKTNTYSYSSARQSLITGMINVGSFTGCYLSAPLAEAVGKRISIFVWCIVYITGVIVQMTASPSWIQIVIAKVWTGFAVGATSVIAPGYQSEVAPASLRGAIVTTYQLFITAGIFVAACINMGTHKYTHYKSASWRVSMGMNLLWGFITLVGITFLPESPRYLIAIGKDEEALEIMSKNNDIPKEHKSIQDEYHLIKADCEIELAGGPAKWYEIFGKEIRFRTLLGFAVMSFQQLTGANYYFYYCTQVFKNSGISSPYAAACILDGVNVFCTVFAMFVLEQFGRRMPLIVGGIWQSICFFIYSAVGDKALYRNDGSSNQQAGAVLIAFSCFFVASFAVTWAPAAYVIVGESYPVRYRSKCAALATSGNWLFDFVVSFFTPFITNIIGFKYGYVFAVCNLIGSVIIFLFAHETKGLTLEEVNQVYFSNLKPWQRNPRKYNSDYSRSQEETIEKEKFGAYGESFDHVENTPNNSSPTETSSLSQKKT
ncbi:hexose transporter Ght5 [Schizosaccharomyces octosporus yFS286]|uniref:Hexose transporter Ght5 n=1 Tax=Schizosaccharomyces octosporus (strain yFS286) TaxID=483514 RepID=S9PR64_SCHOY|nr:hexose transporter Ght5 [Schizosaccharomyces octosporus yFS286]EPX71651.1 hexose transporter Ght5 [Schizosaccharomyces octosporus yFS286]